MQNFITKDDLVTLGIDLDDKEFEKLLSELNEKVAELVGEEIFDALTPEDAEKLATMQKSANDQEVGQWVSEHVPDYPEIIDNNIDIVLGDFIEGNPEEE